MQRWLKMTKYLPDNGWIPTLLVPENAAYPILDPSLVQDVPQNLVVHKVPILEPYEFATKLFSRNGATERLGSLKKGGGKQGITQRLMLWCRGNILLPDPRVLWRRRAAAKAIKIIEKAGEEGRPFDAIVTTGPPHSVHLIGLDLKRKTGLPWLADFRDLWREMDYLEDFLPTARTRRKHKELERDVVTNADAIAYSSPGVGVSLMNNAPSVPKECFHLIYNGWDPTDVTQPHEQGDSGPLSKGTDFHIGHFGSLFPSRDTPGLWQAIRKWNSDSLNRPHKVHLNLVGSVSPQVRESIEQTLKPEDWTDHGYVSHTEAVSMMQSMHALLLIQNDNTTGERAIPGKAFEYLATSRPMGVVTRVPSDLSTLTDEWGVHSCRHANQEEAINMLEKLSSGTGPDRQMVEHYSRPALTRQMSRVLDSIIPSLTS